MEDKYELNQREASHREYLQIWGPIPTADYGECANIEDPVCHGPECINWYDGECWLRSEMIVGGKEKDDDPGKWE